MNGPIDETTEYLIEEYALGRLDGEGLARAEALLRADPALRARADDLRREAARFAGALSQAGNETSGAVDDGTLALLLDGALDEMERAALEASLAGNTAAQSRLAALYRETQAVLNDDPVPTAPETRDTPVVIPFAQGEIIPPGLAEAGALAISAALVLLSLIVQAKVGVPLLFLGLAAFGWWAVRSVARGAAGPVRRRRAVLGIVTALAAFAAAPFTGWLSLWCYVCAAAWYWYWLVQRWAPVPAVKRSASEVERSRPGDDQRPEVGAGGR